jgi:hypothetical protein
MRRQVVDPGSPKVELWGVSKSDQLRIELAIREFRDATPHNNKSFCDLLENALSMRQLSTEVLERLSVWCHTEQPPRGVADKAQAVARELLGRVPLRLRDDGNRRIADYDTVILALKTAFEAEGRD